MSLVNELTTYATKIGLDAVAITSAAPFSAEESILRERIATNLYPSFITCNLAQRCNPANMLPDCRSVIVAAISYNCREDGSDPGLEHIARYARYNDYHLVLKTKLAQLAEFLTQHVQDQHHYRIQVDDGPGLERAAALRSGLGWQGKNNLLYIPGMGSWVVLGLLLTSISLPHQQLHPQSKCGSCEQCIKACPTGALIAPYTIDPQRCLAYVTQMPGLIPHSYRKLMGTRLWGCDTCQTVCPHNANAAIRYHTEWGEALSTPDLIALLRISPTDFDTHFRRTALHWRGYKTLQRNAAIVLGNMRDRAAIEALSDPLRRHSSPILRATCAWALGEIGGESVVNILTQAQTDEKEPTVQAEIHAALAVANKP